MLEDDAIISSRSKEVKIRPLDPVKIKSQRLTWQLVNLVLPILIIVVFGVIKVFVRKRKYARFKTNIKDLP
jgi:hypothetical protein